MIVLETSSDEAVEVQGSKEVLVQSGEVAVMVPSPEVHLETMIQEAAVEVPEPTQVIVYSGESMVLHGGTGGSGGAWVG